MHCSDIIAITTVIIVIPELIALLFIIITVLGIARSELCKWALIHDTKSM